KPRDEHIPPVIVIAPDQITRETLKHSGASVRGESCHRRSAIRRASTAAIDRKQNDGAENTIAKKNIGRVIIVALNQIAGETLKNNKPPIGRYLRHAGMAVAWRPGHTCADQFG